MFDVRTLARVLAEEFERDQWGDIDPDLFRVVAEGGDDSDSDGLLQVLDRVVERISTDAAPNAAPKTEHD